MCVEIQAGKVDAQRDEVRRDEARKRSRISHLALDLDLGLTGLGSQSLLLPNQQGRGKLTNCLLLNLNDFPGRSSGLQGRR